MVAFFDSIPTKILNWIPKQHIFFVSTAPLQADGRVNLSPKGYDDTFHIVDENQVWYEDISGSGIETVSHVKENGRITIMFVAFEGPPNIIRLYGRGTVHEFGSAEYDSFIPQENRKPGSRSVIVIDIYRVSTSCGYGVPLFAYQRPRNTLLEWTSTKETFDINAPEHTLSDRGLRAYWFKYNARSQDGVPGLDDATLNTERAFRKENLVHGRAKLGKDGLFVLEPQAEEPPQPMPGGMQELETKLVSRNERVDWPTLSSGFMVGMMVSTLLVKLAPFWVTRVY